MNGREMTGRANSFAATRYAAALLACTGLAGVPLAAQAQEAAQPAPVPAPAPAPSTCAEGDIIQTIAVAGAQRLEPETIVSYIQLRPNQRYTAAAADQAL
jgi:outer membrane protein insertion porin family